MIKHILIFFWAFISLHFSPCLSAAMTENIILRTLTLYDHGFSYLHPFLKEDQMEGVYSADKEFIKSFPFVDYNQIYIQDQGNFFIDSINDTIKNILRSGQPWDLTAKMIIETYAKSGSVAIDIGAHIGTHTVTMSECVGPQGSVFAFEPNRKIFRELCYNLSVNHCLNVHPMHCAIGKEQGLIQVIVSHPHNEGGCYVIRDVGGSNTAPMIRLDDLQLSNISFIKIDVENMEADVIEGAVDTIKRCRPIILVEIQGNGERPLQLGEDSNAMRDVSMKKIQDLGYSLQPVVGVDYLAFPN